MQNRFARKKRLFCVQKNGRSTDIWEVRVQAGNNIFRILGFIDQSKFVVLTNGFAKKTQKVPKQEIELAE